MSELEKLSPLAEVPFEPDLLPVSQSRTADIFPISSIAKKAAPKELPLPSLKPELTAPALIRHTLRVEGAMKKLQQCNQMALAHDFKQFDELEKQMLLKVKESAAKTQDWNFWKFLQDVGALFISAANTVLGCFFLSSTSSTLIGSALLASGILSIANFVFTHSDVWDALAKKMAGEDETLQKKIRSLLPATIALISTACALGGSVGAALSSSLEFSHLIAIAQTASNLIQGSFTISAAVQESRAKSIELNIDSIKRETQHLNYKVKDILRYMEEFYDFIGKFIQEIDRCIKMTLNQIQTIQQPV